MSQPIALLLALTSAVASDAPAPRPLSAEAARADLALLREAVEVVHPGLGRYEPAEEFARACDALHERLEPGTTDLALYLELSRLAARLRCGHTRVEAPAWLDEWRASRATRLPFRFRLFDGRMFVVRAADEGALPRGTEVLSIEGRAVSELVPALAATVPVDGRTDSIRASRLEEPYEFADSGLDHYLPCLLGLRERFELEVRRPGAGEAARASVAALGPEAWDALAPLPARDLAEAVAWRALDERTALLRVDTFVNYRRPVDAEALFERVFGEIADSGAERLVLDLRACGGGSSDVGWTLARFLVDRPLAPGGASRMKAIRYGALVEHMQTWEPGAFERPESDFEREPDGWYRVREPEVAPLEPHELRFEGLVTVLIGPRNASGATMLLARLAELGAIRTVGEPTGGSAEGPSAGLIYFLTLPASGIRVNVPAARVSSGAREFRPGLGVQPDVLAAPTLADVLAGRDVALEAALAP